VATLNQISDNVAVVFPVLSIKNLIKDLPENDEGNLELHVLKRHDFTTFSLLVRTVYSLTKTSFFSQALDTFWVSKPWLGGGGGWNRQFLDSDIAPVSSYITIPILSK
jgi:hypothetical protein